MDALPLLAATAYALLLGAFGQGLRVCVGLKKRADAVAAQGRKRGAALDAWRLVLSLFVGALAGMAAYLGLQYASPGGADLSQGATALGIVVAGYAGADFIEGVARKWLPREHQA